MFAVSALGADFDTCLFKGSLINRKGFPTSASFDRLMGFLILAVTKAFNGCFFVCFFILPSASWNSKCSQVPAFALCDGDSLTFWIETQHQEATDGGGKKLYIFNK